MKLMVFPHQDQAVGIVKDEEVFEIRNPKKPNLIHMGFFYEDQFYGASCEFVDGDLSSEKVARNGVHTAVLKSINSGTVKGEDGKYTNYRSGKNVKP